jgi:hypothetical protein
MQGEYNNSVIKNFPPIGSHGHIWMGNPSANRSLQALSSSDSVPESNSLLIIRPNSQKIRISKSHLLENLSLIESSEALRPRKLILAALMACMTDPASNHPTNLPGTNLQQEALE